jgi:long-chain acyl-CoA synthetase
MDLAERIRKVLQLGGDSWAVEFEGDTCSWAQLEELGDAIGAALHEAGVKQHDVVGWAPLPAKRALLCIATAAA